MSTADENRLKFTYQDYVLFPDDGRRHEVIDGDHYVSPAPSTYHQTVSKRLQHFLYTKIELAGSGTVFNAPVDLQLSDFDIVQPDLVAIATGSRAQITPAKILGPPELVVEITSPSTSRNDLDLKRKLYQGSGVAEYWIVDTQELQVIPLRLRDGQYEELPRPGQELIPTRFDKVVIPLSQIW